MSSCAASCCTCSRKVSCASATSASWPTANGPLPCHFPSNCSAGHRKPSNRPPPPVRAIFGLAPSVVGRWRSSRGSPLSRCNFVLHLRAASPHETTLHSKKTLRDPHDPSLFALSPDKSLLPASSHALFATFFRNSLLPSASCHLLCSATPSRRTATPALRPIHFP